MDRRTFLSASAALSAVAGAPALGAGLADVVVVGAGVFGVWTALSLRERGYNVTLIDAYGPGNPRASSGGETRHMRAGYGSRAVYSEWAWAAMKLWKQREKEFGRKLVFPVPRLQMEASRDGEIKVQQPIFDRLGIPYEVLGHDDLRRRYPQINFDGVEAAFVESGASSAVLMARESVAIVADAVQAKGGKYRIAQARPGRTSGRTMLDVDLGPTGRMPAQHFVFACGPWLPKVFPKLLRGKITSPRRELYFWGTPAGDVRFDLPNLPTWSDGVLGNYGFPSLGRGVKVSPPHAGLFMQDPDEAVRVASPYLMHQAREWVAKRFPALAEMPIVGARVCQVEMSPTGNFMIDRHPDFDNVWIVGGGSGHGFKHGPVLGAYVADRIAGKPTDPALAHLFAIA